MTKNKKENEETLISPIALFYKYLELIFAKDILWLRFQSYIRSLVPLRDEDIWLFSREPECIDLWRVCVDNKGGGLPLTLYVSAAFSLLAYERLGHDLDKELRYAKAKMTRSRNLNRMRECYRPPNEEASA